MPSGYRLIVLEPGKLELEPYEWAEPGAGQVLLRTDRTLISTGTELTMLLGDFPPGSRWAQLTRYPTPLGYSSVGEVLAVGEGVSTVAPGDRVASWAPHATHGLRSEQQVWRLPAGLDPEPAAFATLAEIVMGGLRRGRVAFGEVVAVVGGGLLGQIAAHFCHVAGARQVLVIDPAAERLPVARALGADHALALTAAEAAAEVERLTAGRMADIVFEVTGSPHAFPGAVKLARRQGRVVLLGSPRGPVTVDLHDEVHSHSLEIIGAHNSAHPPTESPNAPWTVGRHTELFLEWQATGRVDLRPLITQRYSWREALEAFQMLRTDRSHALGVILDWSRD